MPDVDVAEHGDVAIAEHVEHDLAQRPRSLVEGLDRARRPDDHPGDSVEHARLAKDVEVVPDERIRGADLLPEEQRAVEALRVERVRARLQAHEPVEEAPDQSPGRPAGTPGLPVAELRQRHGIGVAREDPSIDVLEFPSSVLGEFVPVAEAMRHEVGVHGHEPGARMQREVQGGDVAEPEQRLRIGPHGVEVDEVEVRERRPSPGEREDRAHLRIAEQPVQLRGDVRRRRGHPPSMPTELHRGRDPHREAEPLDGSDAALEQLGLVMVEAARQRGHRDRVAGFERPRAQQPLHVSAARPLRVPRVLAFLELLEATPGRGHSQLVVRTRRRRAREAVRRWGTRAPCSAWSGRSRARTSDARRSGTSAGRPARAGLSSSAEMGGAPNTGSSARSTRSKNLVNELPSGGLASSRAMRPMVRPLPSPAPDPRSRAIGW